MARLSKSEQDTLVGDMTDTFDGDFETNAVGAETYDD